MIHRPQVSIMKEHNWSAWLIPREFACRFQSKNVLEYFFRNFLCVTLFSVELVAYVTKTLENSSRTHFYCTYTENAKPVTDFISLEQNAAVFLTL